MFLLSMPKPLRRSQGNEDRIQILIVDLGLVFDGYEKTKDFDAKLEVTQEVKQKDRESGK